MLAGEGKVKEAVQKQTPAEFAKNISHEAMTPEVISHMSEDQVKYFIDHKDKVDPTKRKMLKAIATPGTPENGKMMKYLSSADQATINRMMKHLGDIQQGIS
jgi:hypothetical protein